MNKLKKLGEISKFLWFTATVLMVINWWRIVALAFSETHYVIEDKFLYIGVLGGWLFVQLSYTLLFILLGVLASEVINILIKSQGGIKQ